MLEDLGYLVRKDLMDCLCVLSRMNNCCFPNVSITCIDVCTIRVYLCVIQGLQGKAGSKGAKGEVVSTPTFLHRTIDFVSVGLLNA